MTAPDFSDLRPPHDLMTDFKCDSTVNGILRASRWGAHHGYAIGKAEWPDPITDRPPGKNDTDADGDIQALCEGGWHCIRLAEYDDETHEGWLHTPLWRPPAPSKREQALKMIDQVTKTHDRILQDDVWTALRLSREALEEAA